MNKTVAGLQPGAGEVPVELFEYLPDIVFFVKDIHGRYTVVNRTLTERCGCTASELIGKTAADVFAGDLGLTYLEQDMALLKSGDPIIERLEMHIYPSGARGWCLTTKVPIKDSARKICGLAGISRDLRETGESSLGAIAPALAYIREDIAAKHTVSSLACMCGLSVYQFEERMKRFFQLTCGRYISKVRIDTGCNLLQTGEMSIAEIAQVCGYADQSAFSRQFKSLVGMTPGEYRKSRDSR